MRYATSWMICLALLAGTGRAAADSILLANGKVIDGVVVESNADSLTIQSETGRLTLPKRSIQQHIEESALVYQLRMAEEAMAAAELEAVIEHLTAALQEDAQNERALELLDEARALRAMLEKEGPEGLARVKVNQTLLNEAFEKRESGDADGALKAFQAYHESQKSDWRAVIEIAKIHLEQSIRRNFFTTEQLEALEEMARQPVETIQAKFIDSVEPADLQTLTEPKEIFAPLLHLKKAPYSVAAFRELHRGNQSLYNAIFYLERLSRMNVPPDLMLPDPSLQQWYSLVQLIQQQDRARQSGAQEAMAEEAERLKQAFAVEREEMRIQEIARVWESVKRQVSKNQWGRQLGLDIAYMHNLRPDEDTARQLKAFERRNDAAIAEQQRLYAEAQRDKKPTRVWVHRGSRNRPSDRSSNPNDPNYDPRYDPRYNQQYNPWNNQQNNPYTGNRETVYITQTGNRYHNWGCQYLINNPSVARHYRQAQQQGFTPCEVCRPIR